MKVISFNANGIRSAAKKGFFAWLKKQKADIICIQETKAHENNLTNEEFYPKGYHCYYFDAAKKGYSGVAIYSKLKPLKVKKGLGFADADNEGRYIQLDFKNISIASIYVPSGTSGDERQKIKYKFMDRYYKILQRLLKQKKKFIIAGDWNIAHQEIDLKNWRSNQKNSGFLPDERAWMGKLFAKLGYIDAFRYKYPKKIMYTWWSNRGQAWANDVGWRIDYQVLTPNLAKTIISASRYREEKFSDHAPFIVNYDFEIKN